MAKTKKKTTGPQEIPALIGMITAPFRSPQGTDTINRNAQKIFRDSRALEHKGQAPKRPRR